MLLWPFDLPDIRKGAKRARSFPLYLFLTLCAILSSQADARPPQWLSQGLKVRRNDTASPLRQAPRATGSDGSAFFALFELQFLVAAYKTARPTFAGARGLAAVNTLFCDGDFYTTILAIVDIPFFHFTAFWHDSYLLSEDTAWRHSVLITNNQAIGMCQGDTSQNG